MLRKLIVNPPNYKTFDPIKYHFVQSLRILCIKISGFWHVFESLLFPEKNTKKKEKNIYQSLGKIQLPKNTAIFPVNVSCSKHILEITVLRFDVSEKHFVYWFTKRNKIYTTIVFELLN